MHIFFSTSVYGKADPDQNSQAIVAAVEKAGHTIEADHIFSVTPEEMASWTEEQDLAYHKKVLERIKKADALFAEVSKPSTSVGYLIATAVQAGKPVVVFYSGNQEPHLFKSLEKLNDRFQVVRYSTIEELDDEVPYMIDFIESSQDVRFNFFVSPSISSYLDWVSKTKKIPRSVYLRRLIDQDIETAHETPFQAT